MMTLFLPWLRAAIRCQDMLLNAHRNRLLRLELAVCLAEARL